MVSPQRLNPSNFHSASSSREQPESEPLATADFGNSLYLGFLDKGNVEATKTTQICKGQVQGRKIPALAGGGSALAPAATAPTTNTAGLAGAGTPARDAKSVR